MAVTVKEVEALAALKCIDRDAFLGDMKPWIIAKIHFAIIALGGNPESRWNEPLPDSAKPAPSCPHCDRWQAQLSEQLSRVKELTETVAFIHAEHVKTIHELDYQRAITRSNGPTVSDLLSSLPPGSRVSIDLPNDGDD